MTTVQQSGMEIVPLGEGILDLRGNATALEALTRAETDIQIATAKRFPRDPERFLAKALRMVSADANLAAKCAYALPRRDKDGTEKIISGPSVRLAEIVACCWGNLKIGGRIVDDDGKTLTAQGVALDLEENVCYSLEAKRSIVGRNGRRYTDDMVVVTGNALIAIITRNVTYKVVPRAFVSLVEDHARKVARGDERTLPERFEAAVEWFGRKGVSEADLYRTLAIGGRAELTLDHLMTLNGFRTSIAEGVATAAEIFQPPRTETADAAPPEGGTGTGTRTEQARQQLGALFPEAEGAEPALDPAKNAKPPKAEKSEKPAKRQREPGED